MTIKNTLSLIGKGTRYTGQYIHDIQNFGFFGREGSAFAFESHQVGNGGLLSSSISLSVLRTPHPDHLWHKNTTLKEAKGDLLLAAGAIAIMALFVANQVVLPVFLVALAAYVLAAPVCLLAGLGVSTLAGDLEDSEDNAHKDYIP